MRLKLKHLLHPLQTAATLRSLVVAYWSWAKFARTAGRRYAGDPRYRLQAVTDGFADRMHRGGGDGSLLERICRAYQKARERPEAEAHRPTPWWEQVRQASLRPVMQALLNGDVHALDAMYRNFFRDSCSTGLVGRPWGLDGPPKGIQRTVYLGDVLFRLDYWKAQTGGRLAWTDLAGPGVGNPFGLQVGGTLVEAGAEYRHYCAYKVRSLLDPGKATVAEIGGGFGGMAYYLLRDRPGVKYFDFDLPESLALASWHLAKAFPRLTFLFFGEETHAPDAIARADIVLLPLSELPAMPAGGADVTFSSHAISDVTPAGAATYLRDITHMTRSAFLYVGSDRTGRLLAELAAHNRTSLQLAECLPSGWHDHITPNPGFVECLFRAVRSADSRA